MKLSFISKNMTPTTLGCLMPGRGKSKFDLVSRHILYSGN